MLGRILLTTWFVALPVVALADVRVDFDRHKDFSQYKTFVVQVGPLVRQDGSVDEVNTLAENRIRGAVTNELVSRGLTPTEDAADLVVRVSSRDSERVSVVGSAWPHYYGGFWRPWGFRSRFYRFGGYWGPAYYGDVWTHRYLEGALNVDVIDHETGALVYRAHVTDEVGKDLDKDTKKSMDKAFKKFPIKEVGK